MWDEHVWDSDIKRRGRGGEGGEKIKEASFRSLGGLHFLSQAFCFWDSSCCKSLQYPSHPRKPIPAFLLKAIWVDFLCDFAAQRVLTSHQGPVGIVECQDLLIEPFCLPGEASAAWEHTTPSGTLWISQRPSWGPPQSHCTEVCLGHLLWLQIVICSFIQQVFIVHKCEGSPATSRKEIQPHLTKNPCKK